MNRFAAIDEPVSMAALVSSERVARLVDGVVTLVPSKVAVYDRSGDCIYKTQDAPADECEAYSIEYNGDIVGRVQVQSVGESEPERVTDHLIRELRAQVDIAYARHLTQVVHSSAMEESFAELGDRNARLASAVERLEELERLKSNFLATVSHELRTPLTSVIGYAEMLSEGIAGDISDEQREFVQTILSKADQLLQLITGILDVSLIEAKSLQLDIEPLDLPAIIREVSDTMRRDLERRKITLELPIESVPKGLGDKAKIKQVMLHLLANAIKFSPEGGDIQVTVGVGPLSQDDTSLPKSPFWRERLSERFGLRVCVRDHGIGIPQEKRASIFKPFFQVDSGATRAFGGTGLGLSLAQSFVIAHGGFLWVESAAGDEAGSIFTFTLPAVAQELEDFVGSTMVGSKS